MRHRALKQLAAKALNTFEHDPDFQVRFHLAAMYFWMVNLAVGTVMLLWFPHQWDAVGVFYVFALSVYANFDTDYDATSAAQSSKKAGRALETLEQIVHGGAQSPDVVAEKPEGHVASGTEGTAEARTT